MKKAFEFSKKAQDNHLEGVIALEMDRCDMPPDDFKGVLEKAMQGIDPSQFQDSEQKAGFYQMRLRLEEIRKGNYDDLVLKEIFKFKGLELEKLKVAIKCPDASDKLFSCHIELLEKLRCLRFSHFLWEDTVRFIIRLYQDNADFWQELAIDLWEAVEEISGRTSSLHLRWYWSRQRDLYDLAFLSALEQQEFEIAAQIADSVKNRPALTWQALEQMDYSDEVLKKLLKEDIEQNARELSGWYHKKISFHVPDVKMPSFYPEKLETDAILVQFYLVHLKGSENGYALIYDGKTKEWSCESFNFHPIWEKYVQWQSVYFELPPNQREKSANELKQLCEILGEELNFLFKIEQDRKIIFIPHDFLHRVPIHGAINTVNGNINAPVTMFYCAYLPDLSYAKKIQMQSEKQTVLLRYFDISDPLNRSFEGIEVFFDELRTPADKNDLLNLKPPYFLSITCHGIADAVNPFFSKLKLKTHLTLAEFAGSPLTFSSSVIFLSACETDLMSPIDAPLDEHLSMASMFLSKKTHSVIGTMYELYPEKSMVRRLLSEFKQKNFEALFDIQYDLWDRFIKSRENIWLYHCLCLKFYQYL